MFKILLMGIISLSIVAKEQEMLGSLQMPKELALSQIEDKPGNQIPLDIQMLDHLGQKVELKKYFDDKPVIIAMGYYGCPMLCSLVLNGLVKGLKSINYKLGQDYRVVSASIDPKETTDLAHKKRENYLGGFMPNAKDDDWSFHTMSEKEAKRLSEALGFNYFFDKKSKQYAHGAGIFVVSKEGVLSRTLYGIEFKPQDLKLALSEASAGKIGSFVDKIILSCFHYDPDSHKYGVYILGVMRIFGLITVLVVSIILLVFFKKEKSMNSKKLFGK